VRRSRLYYLRDLSGKKARLHSKVRDLSGLLSEDDLAALEAGDSASEEAPVEAASEESGEAASEEQTA
jgi:hypothetical protein